MVAASAVAMEALAGADSAEVEVSVAEVIEAAGVSRAGADFKAAFTRAAAVLTVAKSMLIAAI
jgi:hypothetical protein